MALSSKLGNLATVFDHYDKRMPWQGEMCVYDQHIAGFDA